MRTFRFRFTVRGAMLAVAVIGIICGATFWGARMLRLRSPVTTEPRVSPAMKPR